MAIAVTTMVFSSFYENRSGGSLTVLYINRAKPILGFEIKATTDIMLHVINIICPFNVAIDINTTSNIMHIVAINNG